MGHHTEFGFDFDRWHKKPLIDHTAENNIKVSFDGNGPLKADLVYACDAHYAKIRRDNNTQPLGYQQANFEPGNMTIPELRQILALHNVRMDYARPTKEEMIEVFKQHQARICEAIHPANDVNITYLNAEEEHHAHHEPAIKFPFDNPDIPMVRKLPPQQLVSVTFGKTDRHSGHVDKVQHIQQGKPVDASASGPSNTTSRCSGNASEKFPAIVQVSHDGSGSGKGKGSKSSELAPKPAVATVGRRPWQRRRSSPGPSSRSHAAKQVTEASESSWVSYPPLPPTYTSHPPSTPAPPHPSSSTAKMKATVSAEELRHLERMMSNIKLTWTQMDFAQEHGHMDEVIQNMCELRDGLDKDLQIFQLLG